MKPQDDAMDEANADAATNSEGSGNTPAKAKSVDKDELPIIEDVTDNATAQDVDMNSQIIENSKQIVEQEMNDESPIF